MLNDQNRSNSNYYKLEKTNFETESTVNYSVHDRIEKAVAFLQTDLFVACCL
jgi:hypothetical protein